MKPMGQNDAYLSQGCWWLPEPGRTGEQEGNGCSLTALGSNQPFQHLDLGLLSFAVVEATQLWHFVLAAPGHSCTVVWLALICSEGPDNQGELTTAPETHAPDVLIISRKKIPHWCCSHFSVAHSCTRLPLSLPSVSRV